MGFMVSNKRCSSKYMSQYLENSFKPAPPSLIAIDTSLTPTAPYLEYYSRIEWAKEGYREATAGCNGHKPSLSKVPASLPDML